MTINFTYKEKDLVGKKISSSKGCFNVSAPVRLRGQQNSIALDYVCLRFNIYKTKINRARKQQASSSYM